jgi:molybdopterin synthase catalytic subunit
MRVVVKLFGAVREAVGENDLSVELAEGTSAAVLRERLARDHPIFETLSGRLAVAVNLQVSEPDVVLRDGDEVAFLPPVSGGVGRCWISESPIEADQAVARVAGPDAGGIVTFVGAVRNRARGRDIDHLEYDAYPEMAEREMERITDEAAERWPGVRVSIGHRTGHLKIGDIAVVVAAAAPHRAEAFEACRFAIDTLKQTVPIWKKEFATDGEYWVDPTP